MAFSGTIYATSKKDVLADSVVSSGGQSTPCGASADQNRKEIRRCRQALSLGFYALMKEGGRLIPCQSHAKYSFKISAL